MSSEKKLGTMIAEFKKEAGFTRYEDMVVAVLNQQERLIGELADEDTQLLSSDGTITLKNPKTYLRLLSRSPTGLTIENSIGDYDLIERAGGCIEVKPVAAYKLCWQNEEDQRNYICLYMEYLSRKTLNSARESGLVLPNTGIKKP